MIQFYFIIMLILILTIRTLYAQIVPVLMYCVDFSVYGGAHSIWFPQVPITDWIKTKANQEDEVMNDE